MKSNCKNRKWTAYITVLFMVVSLLTPGLFSKVKAENISKVFDIIEVTDFHGSLIDASIPPLPVGGVLAKNIKDIKKSNPDRTLIIGAGDLYQGSPMSNVLFGVPVQKLMSNIGMEVTTLGNHEFDWGLDKIKNVTMKDAKYSIVCSNVYEKDTNKRAFEPYKIIAKDGVKIAVIGALTTETPTAVLPENVKNYEFRDPSQEINSVAKQIKDNKEADVILVSIHEGSNLDCKTGPIFDITEKLTNVDAVLAGHSHTIVQAMSKNNIPIVIGKSNGKGFIDLKMSVENDKVKFLNVGTSYNALDTKNTNGYKADKPLVDSEAMDIIKQAQDEVGPTFGEVIGNAKTDLTRNQDVSPYGESYLGNWISDSIRNKVKADVAFQNNGGIRCDIPKGDLTVGSMFYLMPFDNEIITLDMTKAQIKKVFEQAVGHENRGIQTSGVKVVYNMSKPEGSRVVNITREDGKEILDTETLRVATNDFLATGGDGFTGFVDDGVKDTFKHAYILVRDILIENIRANKGIVTVMNNRISSAGCSVSNIKGKDRYETAAMLSKANWEKGSEYAVIASGEGFADTLCAVPLAKKLNAPIIFTQSKALTAESKAELERLGVKHVIIIGGTGVVDKSVEDSITKSLSTKPDVKRIGGADRFETSVKIASEIGNSNGVMLTYGHNYADSMSIAPIAAAKSMPILLTDKNKLSDRTKNYMTQSSISNSYVIGLEGVINKDVENQINKITSKKAIRIGGADRFATNIEIIKHFSSDIKSDKMFMAIGDGPNGDEFADGLAGANIAAKGNSPLILVYKNTPKVTKDYVKNNMDLYKNIVTIGAAEVPSAVSQ